MVKLTKENKQETKPIRMADVTVTFKIKLDLTDLSDSLQEPLPSDLSDEKIVRWLIENYSSLTWDNDLQDLNDFLWENDYYLDPPESIEVKGYTIGI